MIYKNHVSLLSVWPSGILNSRDNKLFPTFYKTNVYEECHAQNAMLCHFT